MSEQTEALNNRQEKRDQLEVLIPELTDRNRLVFGEDGSGYSEKLEYPFVVDRQIFKVSDKTSLTYGLNSTKKFVLGDNTSITMLNGVNLDVSLSIRCTGDDEKHERPRISFSGIAKSVVISAEPYRELQLDTVHSSEVSLPNLKNLLLHYGNINTVASERLLGVEFMRPALHSNDIDLNQCNYANFRLITKGAIEKNDLDPIPVFKNLASADTDIEGYLNGKEEDFLFDSCREVNLPTKLKNDPGITQAQGVNIVQYQRGMGRISHEVMTGISKSEIYATDQYSNVYCTGAKFTVICAPFSTESIYTLNTSNSYVRAFDSSAKVVMVADVSTVLQGLKMSSMLVGMDFTTKTAKIFKKHMGTEIEERQAAKLTTSVQEITNQYLQSDTIQTLIRNSIYNIRSNEMDLSTANVQVSENQFRSESSNVNILVSNNSIYS